MPDDNTINRIGQNRSRRYDKEYVGDKVIRYERCEGKGMFGCVRDKVR